GVALAQAYSAAFVAASDFSMFVSVGFAAARSHRGEGTVSYDVTVTNTGAYDLLVPLMLVLDPAQYFSGQPLGASGQTASGLWLIDLGDGLTGGALHPGQSTIAQTLTVQDPDGQRVAFAHGVFAMPYPNAAPVFDS